VLFRCVQFAQDAISGLALLELAGVNSGQPPQVYDWGGGAETVCQVDREPGAIPDRCFGPTSGPNWSDWTLTPNGWAERPSGAGGYAIHDGDVEGWSYTSGFGAPPPVAPFGQVCPPVSVVAAATSPPSATPRLATTAPSVQSQPVPSPTVTTNPTPAPSLLAIAPMVSPTARTALAEAGSNRSPQAPVPTGPLVVIALAVGSLLTLGYVNFRRRAP
jgi:hypothetical protein